MTQPTQEFQTRSDHIDWLRMQIVGLVTNAAIEKLVGVKSSLRTQQDVFEMRFVSVVILSRCPLNGLPYKEAVLKYTQGISSTKIE